MISAVMPTYGRADVEFVKGEGAYLFDVNGNRYLDFASGVAVTALGHCHPHLVAALQEQAATLWHASNLFRLPDQEKLAERLVENSFADTVFFANSGAEAVECGLKMVRKTQHVNGHPERYRVISCEGAFHGRTLATIAANGDPKYTEGFDPIVDGFDHVPFGNLNAMRAAITPETAAIIVEPVQGEGGIHPTTKEYLQGLRDTADEFGLLLFFDEVQTGMGRTGKLFAHEWSGVTPDVMSLAKGLGGGFPIGACLATEQAAAGLTPGSHGSTFGGNPLATSAANAVLDVMLENGFMESVDSIAHTLWGKVETLVNAHPKVFKGVRGLGLMVGLECEVTNGDVINALRANGLLAVPAGGNVVRLLPPLIIDESHVDEAIAVLEKTALALEKAP